MNPGLERMVAVSVMVGVLVGGTVGCSAVGGFAGAAAGVASGAVTTNPAVGIGVGITVNGAVNAAVNYAFRTLHQGEQDHIAALAGTLPIGAVRPWEIKNRIPYGNEHGQVQVIRDIHTPLARCRELLFSVEDEQTQWFEGKICQQTSGQWKWASAEPATERWGSLH